MHPIQPTGTPGSSGHKVYSANCSTPYWASIEIDMAKVRVLTPFRAAALSLWLHPVRMKRQGTQKGRCTPARQRSLGLLSLSQHHTLISQAGCLQPTAPDSSVTALWAQVHGVFSLTPRLFIPLPSMQMLSDTANDFTFAIKIFTSLVLINSIPKKGKATWNILLKDAVL